MSLGKSLKKIGKTAVQFGSLGLIGGDPFSSPRDPAPNAPNLNFLDDTSKFNFLQDPNRYGNLRDAPSTNRFLVNPSDLVKGAAGVGGNGDQAFQDYINSISAPSSVDAVRGEIDNDQLSQLLAGIDEDTKNASGDLSMDFADRGVAGPGQISDAEASGLGRLAGLGVKSKAAARVGLAQTQLQRLSDKEKAAQAAYGQRYGTSASEDEQMRQLYGQGYQDLFGAGESEAGRNIQQELGLDQLLSGDASTYAGIINARDLSKAGQLSSAYNTQLNNRQARQPGIFENLLRNVNLNVPMGG